MFAPLTRPDLGAASPDARLYCRPVCFVDRPHELDDACLHLADTMLWFAAWNVSLRDGTGVKSAIVPVRSEEHTSELQSLMRISYAVFCLKKQNTKSDKMSTHTIRTTTEIS